ncbi:MAG TPA: hypothetical protein VF762_10300, partial [Blastocatellia bacterium]
MKKFHFSFAVALVAVCVLFTAAQAQTEGAGAPEIIRHRTNARGAGQPTTGSTGVVTPAITYHGGALMPTPTMYLIWYGNWNQTNGSDTPAG